MIYTVLILFFVSGLCMGLMDAVNFHQLPDWMDPDWWKLDKSWCNQYRIGWKIADLFGLNFSDGWHSAKSIMLYLLSYCAALQLVGADYIFLLLGATVLVRFAFGVGFWLTYTYIRK